MSGFLDIWISLTGQYFIHFLGTSISGTKNVQIMIFYSFFTPLNEIFRLEKLCFPGAQQKVLCQKDERKICYILFYETKC